MDTKTKESLPYQTSLGSFTSMQSLHADGAIPVFRFGVPRCTASGAVEGRAVDDLTASGGNYRSGFCETLGLMGLDDFAAMVGRVSQLSPERMWHPQGFFT